MSVVLHSSSYHVLPLQPPSCSSHQWYHPSPHLRTRPAIHHQAPEHIILRFSRLRSRKAAGTRQLLCGIPDVLASWLCVTALWGWNFANSITVKTNKVHRAAQHKGTACDPRGWKPWQTGQPEYHRAGPQAAKSILVAMSWPAPQGCSMDYTLSGPSAMPCLCLRAVQRLGVPRSPAQGHRHVREDGAGFCPVFEWFCLRP